MSRIHDALRRGRRQTPSDRPPAMSAHADTVLATLGYKSENAATSTRRLAFALVAVAAAGAAYLAWALWPASGASVSGPTLHAAPPPQRPPAVRPSAPAPAPVVTARSMPAVAPAQTAVHAAAAPSLPTVASDRERTARARPVVLAPQSPSGDDFKLALYYQRAGQFDQALVHYKAVLQRGELDLEAHNNLGLLYKDKGLLDEAVGEFRRALSIAPRYARAHNNLGVTLLELGRLDAAAAELRAALAIDPRNVDAMVNLALTQKAAGQAMDAKGSLIRALDADPHGAAAHYNLGLLYEETGEAARAIEHYRAFLQYAGPEHASRAPDVRARIATLESGGRQRSERIP